MISCKVCGTEFEPKHPANKICSDECRAEQQKISRETWRKKNPQTWTSYTEKYRSKNPLKARLCSLRAHCKRNGIPFDLTEDWIKIPEVCPVLEIPLDGSDRDHQWSFDRVVPEKGYVKSNVKIISMRANRLKNDSSILDVERILRYMKENS